MCEANQRLSPMLPRQATVVDHVPELQSGYTSLLVEHVHARRKSVVPRKLATRFHLFTRQHGPILADNFLRPFRGWGGGHGLVDDVHACAWDSVCSFPAAFFAGRFAVFLLLAMRQGTRDQHRRVGPPQAGCLITACKREGRHQPGESPAHDVSIPPPRAEGEHRCSCRAWRLSRRPTTAS